MSMYFRFPRPGSDEFLKARTGYIKLLVPPANHPTEKNCYAVIDMDKLEVFLHHFGDMGEIILEDEMPEFLLNGNSRENPYKIVIPKD